MGYMLPLRFIRVSRRRNDGKQFDVAICATRVVAVMSTEIYQARRTIAAEKKAGTLINACGTAAAKSVIILDNGSVVASPLSVSVILNSVERSNSKANAKQTKRLTVYDVYDEEPDEKKDDDFSEMTYDDEEDDDIVDE